MKHKLSGYDLREICLILGIYIIFSSLWIYCSDHLLAALMPNPELRMKISVYKGIGFILITSFLVLLPLIARYAKKNKKAEETARHQSEKLQLALDSAKMEIFDINALTGEVILGDRSLNLLGITRESEQAYEAAKRRIHPEDWPVVEQAVKHTLDPSSDGKFDVEFRIVQSEGSVHWLSAKGQAYCEGWGADRRTCRLMGVYIDVTARKKAEEKLRQSEERFRLIADSIPDLVWIAQGDGTIEYANKAFRDYTGLNQYDSELAFVHPEDREATMQVWLHSMRTGTPYEIEHRFQRHDGVYRWYLCRAIPVRDPEGNIIQWYGTSTDIHDLKSAHVRIASILDSTSDGFIAIDRQWTVTNFNRKAEEMAGVKAEEMVGRNYWEASPQTLGTRLETEFRLAMEEKKSAHFEEYHERYARLLDVNVHPYADGIAIFFHDLSERERAAQALRARTAELESLLRHAPIGFAFFDKEHRYLRLNRTLAEINGIPEEETIGKPIRDVLPTNAASVDPILDRVFATGEAVEAEIAGETPRAPGVVRYWLTGFFPVFHSSDTPVAAGAYVVDITERKQTEEALARLAAIVRGAEDAIFSEDLSGIIQTWNRGAERLYGYSAGEVIGRHVSILVPPENFGELDEMDRKMREGIQDQFETVRVTKEGKRIFVFLSMSPIRNQFGNIVGVSKIVHNISKRKLVEQNLKETVRALERSNRDLKQFAYVAAHDLQEPLRNVTRYVELFARKFEGQVDEKAGQYIGYAVEGANRIHGLIRDLLVYSEVGAQATEFRPVSMLSVAEEAIDNLAALVDESKAAITMDAMPEVHGDRAQLVQLMQNLLSNAMKFRKKEVALQIRVSAQRTPQEWQFGVHDNGIGIDPLFVEKIFVIFQRLHSRSEYPGTGIGLAICRKIAEWHGGRIWVESTYGEGASFYFTIPIRGGVL